MTDSLPDARQFLARYWQKKPLFVRNALPSVANLLQRREIFELACRDDIDSRLVIGARNSWRVEHGPFRKRDLMRMPPREWTLLVNGLESVLPGARKLQQAFDFIPYARHDDVMVSYAMPGGSVGPHFDSYDVALVQGAGVRRWRIGAQRDLGLVAGAPLKILRRFRAQREWQVHAGDMLYLPPRYAHHGVALDECITWSVGFRAPGRQEIIERFIDFLRDQPRADEIYRDPQLKPQRHAGAINPDLLQHVQATIASLKWTAADVERCLGELLTEPRTGVVFAKARRVPAPRFAALALARGLRLALPTRMLTSGNIVFINSESTVAPPASRATLSLLADARAIPPATRINAPTRELLYEWYCAGYIELGDER